MVNPNSTSQGGGLEHARLGFLESEVKDKVRTRVAVLKLYTETCIGGKGIHNNQSA